MTESLDFKALVHAAADAIIAARADGTIVFWNPAATRLFGFSAEEALGQSLDLIIPERFRPRHWEGYREVMATGRTKYQSEVLRVPAQRKDGRPLSIAFTVSLLTPASGTGRVIAAIVRDETARWNEERELRRRLSELQEREK
ncbi:MAG TPA: PAS domain-containing protein [Terriglobales bacterium]|nr:PAS domain-containing protein [Terriglobales bacterium]